MEKQKGFAIRLFSQGFLHQQKGFLGPIGDDLPSLIPLLFALVMFFSTFTFTFNIFDERNSFFNSSLEVLRVSSTLKGNSYVQSHDKFMELCSTAKSIKKIKFRAGLLAFSSEEGLPFEQIDVFGHDIDFFESADGEFSCINVGEEDWPVPRDNPIIRIYPVALEFNTPDRFYVKPMLLVVVSWNY